MIIKLSNKAVKLSHIFLRKNFFTVVNKLFGLGFWAYVEMERFFLKTFLVLDLQRECIYVLCVFRIVLNTPELVKSIQCARTTRRERLPLCYGYIDNRKERPFTQISQQTERFVPIYGINLENESKAFLICPF